MINHSLSERAARACITMLCLVAAFTAHVCAAPAPGSSQSTDFSVQLSPEDSWKAFATSGGLQTWSSAASRIALEQRGEVALHLADSRASAVGSDDMTYSGRIVAFDPGRTLVLAPAFGMEEEPAGEDDRVTSWTSIEVRPDPNATDVSHITIVSRVERDGAVPPDFGTALRRVARQFVGAATARRPTLAERLAAVPASAPVRVLGHTVELPIPPSEAWAYFTTAEGMRAWMSARVAADFRTGGTVQSRYDAEGEIGAPGTIVQRLLVVAEPRFYVAQVKPDPLVRPSLIGEQVWSFIRFDPTDEGGTVVTINGINWGDDELSRELMAFFDQANPMLLEILRRHVASQTADGAEANAEEEGARAAAALRAEARAAVVAKVNESPRAGEAAAPDRDTATGNGDAAGDDASSPEERDRVLATIARLVGGEWIHDGTAPNGQPFLVRSIFEAGPGGQSFTARGWLGGAEGMFYHGATQCWVEPGGYDVRFQNLNEQGAVARGALRSDEEGVLIWDWLATSPDGTTQRYSVRTELTGEDTYRFQLAFQPADGGEPRPLVDIEYQRMAAGDVPEKFRRIAGE
jgi:uncharacterized protein YndB with AHSA1/START domain